MNYAKLREIANQRYMTDPKFHTKVEHVINTIQDEIGTLLLAEDASLVRLSASVALIVNEFTVGSVGTLIYLEQE